MPNERPERPQGQHVRQLREFLGLRQTDFGALLRLNQPEVSVWESPSQRDSFLPPRIAKPFLELWDCFPDQPKGGLDEITARLRAMRNPGRTPERELIRLVPEHPGPAEPPRLYWEPQKATPAKEPHLKPPKLSRRTRTWRVFFQRGPLPPDATLHELVLPGAAARNDPRIFMARAGGSPEPTQGKAAFVVEASGAPADGTLRSVAGDDSRWRGLSWRLAIAASLAILLPVGCLRTEREASRGKSVRIPILVPDLLHDTDNSEVALSQDGSIPMPSEPYEWQKKGPCDTKRGEIEKRGGCWRILYDTYAPCPDYSVEDTETGKCLIPIPARPKRPSTKVPMKP